MNQTNKTIAFITVGLVLAVCAAASSYLIRPKPVTGFELVGQEFFPSFEDAALAKSLEVVALDADKNIPREFKVEFRNGVWSIPSHHDYPAEAAKRLGESAAAVIGLVRESLVARRQSQHDQYGVIDPTDEDARDAEATGKRITFRDGDGEILADYIIGKPAGKIADESDRLQPTETSKDDFYFVRVPGEKETYKTKVDIDLSTRFADWIEPDLLKLDSKRLRKLEIDNYRLEQNMVPTPQGLQIQQVKVVGEKPILNREGDFDPWTMDGVNEETEELQTEKITQIVDLLDDMTIVGVRPKLKYEDQTLLTPDLSLREIPSLVQNQQLLRQKIGELRADLESKGFAIGVEDPKKPVVTMIAKNGELTATTDEGVAYTLYFGDVFLGDESSIEIGGNEQPVDSDETKADDEKSAESEQPSADPSAQTEAKDDQEPKNEDEGDGRRKSRFVAIRVAFDQQALGDKPVKPTEPVKPSEPEGYLDWKEAKAKERQEQAETEKKQPNQDQPGSTEKSEENKAQSNDKDAQADDAKSDEKTAEQQQEQANQEQANQEKGDQESDDAPQPPDDIASANDKKFEEYEKQLAQHAQEKSKYNTDLTTYEKNIEAYEIREESGRQQSDVLNQRFAEWYYVVPSESFAKLKLARTDLVQAKATDPPLTPPAAPGAMQLPSAPNIEFSEDQKATEKDNKQGDPSEKKSAPGKDDQ